MSRRRKLTDETTGVRINALRNEHGMLQSDLADELNRVAMKHGVKEPRYSNSSVSKWESRGSTPRVDSLQYLSEIFNVSVSYLTGDSDSLTSFHSLISERNMYRELDIEVLEMKYDGLSVWVEMDPDTKKGRFALVDTDKRSLVFKDCTSISYVDCEYKIFAGPNPFSVSMMALDEPPLNLEDISDGLRVWVEMIQATEAVRDTYRGWYKYDAATRSFIGANGLPLPAGYYGKSFVAFTRSL